MLKNYSDNKYKIKSLWLSTEDYALIFTFLEHWRQKFNNHTQTHNDKQNQLTDIFERLEENMTFGWTWHHKNMNGSHEFQILVLQL